jgi:hypothetical protein
MRMEGEASTQHNPTAPAHHSLAAFDYTIARW